MLDALDEIALTRGVSVGAVADRVAAGQAGHRRADRERPHGPSSCDGILPAFTLDPSEVAKLDEVST